MVAMKRPAAASSPGRKKTRHDPVASGCAEVSDLISQATGYPDEVLTMLTGAVQDCLTEPSETRHAYQKKVVGMLREVLSDVQASTGNKVAELQHKLAAADQEKAARENAIEQAAQSVAWKASTLDSAKGAHAQALEHIHNSKKDKEKAREEQVAGDKVFNAANKQKEKLEGMFNGDYNDLKQGTHGSARVIAKFVKFSKEFDFDTNLINSAQKTFNTPVAARGHFDEMVLSQIDDAFQAAIAKEIHILQEGQAGKALREQNVQTAITQYDGALDWEKQKKDEVNQATADLGEAHTHKKDMDKSLREFGPEMQQVSVDLSEAQDQQQTIATVVETFEKLVSRSSDSDPFKEPEAVDYSAGHGAVPVYAN